MTQRQLRPHSTYIASKPRASHPEDPLPRAKCFFRLVSQSFAEESDSFLYVTNGAFTGYLGDGGHYKNYEKDLS